MVASDVTLRPQDLLLALGLLTHEAMPAPELARHLGLSTAETYNSAKRLVVCHLARPSGQRTMPHVIRRNLLEYLQHGVRYAYPAVPGGLTRGVPTAHGAPPLNADIVQGDSPPVWPHPEGTARGFAVTPVYRSVPGVALRDPALHELLALVDGVRIGTVREQKLAREHLSERLTPTRKDAP